MNDMYRICLATPKDLNYTLCDLAPMVCRWRLNTCWPATSNNKFIMFMFTWNAVFRELESKHADEKTRSGSTSSGAKYTIWGGENQIGQEFRIAQMFLMNTKS